MNIWKLSGDFFQLVWDKILLIFGNDQFNLYVYGSTMFTVSLYWFIGSTYIFFDMTKRFRKYKVQPGTNDSIEIKRLISVILTVLSNQLLVAFPSTLIGFWFAKATNNLPPIQTLPTFSTTIVDFIVFIVLEEIAFYYSHRLLHHRFFYKAIHKKHHEWTSPIAIAASYCHPIEHLLSNTIPPVLGPTLRGSHLGVAWLWFAFITHRTLYDHSGYYFPFTFMSPLTHDFHHSSFTECYGTYLGLLDYFHGTNQSFRTLKKRKSTESATLNYQ